jgi:hypothetical protein
MEACGRGVGTEGVRARGALDDFVVDAVLADARDRDRALENVLLTVELEDEGDRGGALLCPRRPLTCTRTKVRRGASASVPTRHAPLPVSFGPR